MTIEITSPETEALIQHLLQNSRFHNIDELLVEALGALQEKHRPERNNPLTNAERRKREDRKSLAELFAESPFKGLNLEFDESEEEKDFGRDNTFLFAGCTHFA